MMEETVPSLVLTDIALPRMSGINLLKRIKRHPEAHDRTRDPDHRRERPRYEGYLPARRLCRRTSVNRWSPAHSTAPFNLQQNPCPGRTSASARPSRSSSGTGPPSEGALRTEYATAISEGGLYVRTLYPLPGNTLAPISIFMGDHEIGRRRWCSTPSPWARGPFLEPGMGLKFVEIGEGTGRSSRTSSRNSSPAI